MKRKFIKIAAVALVFAFAVCFSACSGKANTPSDVHTLVLNKNENGLYDIEKSGNSLHYYCSDEGIENFLNDYYSRHIRDNTDKSIGDVQLGVGPTFQKGWESKYLSWFDSTEIGVSGYDALQNFSSGLDSMYVDQFGSVDCETFVNYAVSEGARRRSLGWGFVNGMQTHNWGVEFNKDSDFENWTVNGSDSLGAFAEPGYYRCVFSGGVNESLVYSVNGLDASLKYAPMIEIAMLIKDTSGLDGRYANIEDIVLSFKLKDSNKWIDMSYYDEAIHNEKIDGNGLLCTWFPIYLLPEWSADGVITDLKIEIKPQEGKKLRIDSNLNYVRLETDTRMTTNNNRLISGMEEYVSFTADRDMLERNLDKCRRAMLFQLYALDGINGLLKTDYIQGKTTTLGERGKFNMQGNSWYDVLPTGTVNMEANINFYESLLAMAKLEEYAASAGINVEGSHVRNPHPYAEGAENIAWNQTPASLRALAETVKGNMQKNVADGGLWNPDTGRFAWAIYDEGSSGTTGTAMDYGHTEINLMAVADNIASEAQKDSIMSWLNGTRTVAGDDSQGEDIYFYRFAPRISTKSNSKDVISIWKLGQFGKDIQNGGASMHISFYDLLARNAYYGADNTYSRLKSIQNWYEDVQKSEGNGKQFYRVYYGDMQAEDGNVYKMQGGGTAGPIGLDYEFYESALLYASIPYTFFGLDADYDTLKIAPSLPDAISYFAMENLMFGNVRYDLCITDSAAVISGVRGASDKKVCLTFKAKAGQKAYVNYRETEYAEKDGFVTVEVPLAQCVVEIK